MHADNLFFLVLYLRQSASSAGKLRRVGGSGFAASQLRRSKSSIENPVSSIEIRVDGQIQYLASDEFTKRDKPAAATNNAPVRARREVSMGWSAL
jgi:hypothetical protein